MVPSPGSVKRVSEAVVPCVPYAVAGVVPKPCLEVIF